MVRARPAAPLAALVLLVVALTPQAASPACEPEVVRGLGPACRLGDGLLEVRGPRGEALGTTHGPDPPDAVDYESGPNPLPPLASPHPVACVRAGPGTYHIQLLYARAWDDADRLATVAPQMRDMTERANGLLLDAAQATGGTRADLRVACAPEGVIHVLPVALPTPKAQATFATIVTDLRDLGFTDGRVKHGVFYDDDASCGCGGAGHVYNDDRLTLLNSNNGNAASMFAVSFGTASVRTWLHELAHTLGAVQHGAPHATQGYHCTDGLDVLCYRDGGANGADYTFTRCLVEVFDCGKDDYFHRNPAPGSHLASHWNLASGLNRYLEV